MLLGGINNLITAWLAVLQRREEKRGLPGKRLHGKASVPTATEMDRRGFLSSPRPLPISSPPTFVGD